SRVKVKPLPEIRPSVHQIPATEHPLFILLLEKCKEKNHLKPGEAGKQADYVIKVFHQYARELKAIRQIYTLGNSPLSEEEVFMGTILEQSSQTKMRDEMSVRLREVSGQLVDRIRWTFEGYLGDPLMPWLARTFYAFQYALSPAAGKNKNGGIVTEWKEAQYRILEEAEAIEIRKRSLTDSRRQGHVQ
ncbi:4179_t:CDS:2, partial [Acaulospora colombiana]